MFIATDFNPWYKEIDERFWRNFCTDKAKIMTKSRYCLLNRPTAGVGLVIGRLASIPQVISIP